MSIRPAIIGNWKMNGSGKDVKLVRRFADFLDKQKIVADVMICPPSTLIDRVGEAIKAQNSKSARKTVISSRPARLRVMSVCLC